MAHTDTGEVLLVVQRGAVTVQIRMWPEGAVQTARALADSAAKALGHTFQGRPA